MKERRKMRSSDSKADPTRWDRQLWATVAILCGALFLDAMDVSSVNIALPTIGSHLDMSASTLQWVVSGYVLGYGGFLLLGGRAADLLGRRRVFLVALGVFALASVLGGVASDGTLVVRLRGYQWWWQVTYADPRPDRMFVTANEIHVPVGRPVRIELSAADVIHSFWVPNLSGKQDLIPGRDNSLTFTASQPGIYRGQCAQFCGLQPAHMASLVVAAVSAFDVVRLGQPVLAFFVPLVKPLTDPRALDLRKRDTAAGERVRRDPALMLQLLLSALP